MSTKYIKTNLGQEIKWKSNLAAEGEWEADQSNEGFSFRRVFGWVKYFSIKPAKFYVWEPLPNITIHELAMAMPYIIHGMNEQTYNDNLNRYWTKHFKEIE